MCSRINSSPRPIERPDNVRRTSAPTSQPPAQRPQNTPSQPPQDQKNTVQVRNTRQAAMNPVSTNFSGGGGVTRDTLMNALGRSDLASRLSNPANRRTMENIADKCIEVGRRENVDPRLLFAMAMQESDCGLSLDHAGSATGAMGIMPGALRAVMADRTLSRGLEGTSHSQLRNNHDKSITVAARYLKVAAREFESATRGNTGVSASDLAPGNLGPDTWKILASYRHGAGAAARDYNADRDIDRGYERDFQNYLRLLNVNIR